MQKGPVCAKDSWRMRKGTASVGDAAVGRRWVLRWEEVVKGTPAAAYAGEKMES